MKYTYTNPVSAHVTLGDGSDLHLHAGQSYELPQGNAYIQGLVDQGHLVPDELAKPTPKKSNLNNNA